MSTKEESTSHVDEIVTAAIRAVAPEVLEQTPLDPDSTVSRSILLNALLAAKGPEAVYTLAEHIPHAPPQSPLTFMMMNATSPAALIRKFTYYQRYFHPTRYLELKAEGSHFVLAEAVISEDAPMLTAGDSLLTCGTLKVLLELIGCRGLQVEWHTVHLHELVDVLAQMNVTPRGRGPHTAWRFTWEHFERQQTPAVDEFFLATISSTSEPATPGVSQAVEAVVKADLTARHSVESVATQLGVSPRTLQRKLAAENVSFSRLYTELRVQAAERLIQGSRLALTDIAYLAGFADSAHFCRVFRKMRNINPRDMRRRAQAGERDLAAKP